MCTMTTCESRPFRIAYVLSQYSHLFDSLFTTARNQTFFKVVMSRHQPQHTVTLGSVDFSSSDSKSAISNSSNCLPRVFPADTVDCSILFYCTDSALLSKKESSAGVTRKDPSLKSLSHSSTTSSKKPAAARVRPDSESSSSASDHDDSSGDDTKKKSSSSSSKAKSVTDVLASAAADDKTQRKSSKKEHRKRTGSGDGGGGKSDSRNKSLNDSGKLKSSSLTSSSAVTPPSKTSMTVSKLLEDEVASLPTAEGPIRNDGRRKTNEVFAFSAALFCDRSVANFCHLFMCVCYLQDCARRAVAKLRLAVALGSLARRL
jgi:hypothetical protein